MLSVKISHHIHPMLGNWEIFIRGHLRMRTDTLQHAWRGAMPPYGEEPNVHSGVSRKTHKNTHQPWLTIEVHLGLSSVTRECGVRLPGRHAILRCGHPFRWPRWDTTHFHHKENEGNQKTINALCVTPPIWTSDKFIRLIICVSSSFSGGWSFFNAQMIAMICLKGKVKYT